MYIGHTMPHVGNTPIDLSETELCYTHTSPITTGGETYKVVCDVKGSVVSIMLPGDSRTLHICEVQVYGNVEHCVLDYLFHMALSNYGKK